MGSAFSALGPLLGRFMIALVFIYSGYNKFAAVGRTASSIAGRGLPYATSAAYAAGSIELLGALLLVLGIKTRAVAMTLLGYLVIVTWLFHWHSAVRGDHYQVIQLLKNAGIAGGMLLLASFGPGRFSIDRG